MSAGIADTAADFAAVSAGAADSAAVETLVETLMAPPVPGVQKPPRWVGKRFRDRFAAAPPRRTQTRQAERSSAGSSLGRLELELVLCLGKKQAGASNVFLKFLIIESTASSSHCKNSLGRTIGAP